MRGLRSTEAGIRVVELPEPDRTGVRVRVRSSGICGSDLHLAGMGPMPVTLGHEFAGLLDDGTAVAVCPMVPCGRCDQCRAGREQLCRTLTQRIYGVSLDGGLADEAYVEERCLLPLPGGVDVADGALVEPLAVALHGIHQAGLVPGRRVLVVGGGSIGLATVAAARHLGLEVDLAARHPGQKERGSALGAGEPRSADYDAVVDAAGTQSALDRAVEVVVPGGVIVAVATYWEPVTIGYGLLGKEARLVPASMYGHRHGDREFVEAAAMLAARPGLGELLVTHRLPLEEGARAFSLAADRAQGAVKVLVEP
ncbi:MAG TPA: alcohol dehydrogenase catalytic domain-containing protein [Acidimicrobiales bacterium]|nr:alcohol dehydrogenase catalytic domain-containing protein [Acidimicrobiales bacterium]